MTRSAATMPSRRCAPSPGKASYLVVGFAAGDIPKIPLNLALLKGCDIVGVFWGDLGRARTRSLSPGEHRRAARDVRRRARSSRYVSERFPLARAADAIAHLGSRKAMGKVVVTVD